MRTKTFLTTGLVNIGSDASSKCLKKYNMNTWLLKSATMAAQIVLKRVLKNKKNAKAI